MTGAMRRCMVVDSDHEGVVDSIAQLVVYIVLPFDMLSEAVTVCSGGEDIWGGMQNPVHKAKIQSENDRRRR
jgi:hypothetical protein